jgi:fructokinase
MPGRWIDGMLTPVPGAAAGARRALENERRSMFLVCGEALMDVFSAGETATGLTLDARVGGSPFNVAVGLARLARPVAFFSAVSRGFVGERLVRALVAEGVDTSTVSRNDAPSTLSLVGVDAKGVPSYAFYGEGGADRQLGAEALAALPSRWQVIHLGSFAAVVPPIATTLRALVERERGHTLIAYDPNIRLNVEPDIQRWRDTLQWMLPRTHLLKLSEEDLGLLYPGRDSADLAGECLAQGVSCVVVTHGGEGASAWRAGEHLHVDPVAVAVVDTVGAGDTFQAALLTAMAERGAASPQALRDLAAAPMQQVLEFAARAAALTCSRRGADLPRRNEL